MLACTRCKGEKTTFSPGFTSLEGVVYPDRTSTCHCCNGVGTFPEVNGSAIIAAIIASKGKNKGRLRATMVSPHNGTVEANRAYYVWRLARFHGGKDMTMPMTADMINRGDPYKDELDKLSDVIAKASFGTDMAAAHAWGRALGLAQ